MSLTIQNNFSKLKGEFKTDTGLDVDQNMVTYIAYFNARMTDKLYQVNHYLVEQTLNQFNLLPSTIGLRVAEAIKAIPK